MSHILRCLREIETKEGLVSVSVLCSVCITNATVDSVHAGVSKTRAFAPACQPTACCFRLFLRQQIMLGVDRLDMVKGIPQKLLAYEKFLEVSWPPS